MFRGGNRTNVMICLLVPQSHPPPRAPTCSVLAYPSQWPKMMSWTESEMPHKCFFTQWNKCMSEGTARQIHEDIHIYPLKTYSNISRRWLLLLSWLFRYIFIGWYFISRNKITQPRAEELQILRLISNRDELKGENIFALWYTATSITCSCPMWPGELLPQGVYNTTDI